MTCRAQFIYLLLLVSIQKCGATSPLREPSWELRPSNATVGSSPVSDELLMNMRTSNTRSHSKSSVTFTTKEELYQMIAEKKTNGVEELHVMEDFINASTIKSLPTFGQLKTFSLKNGRFFTGEFSALLSSLRIITSLTSFSMSECSITGIDDIALLLRQLLGQTSLIYLRLEKLSDTCLIDLRHLMPTHVGKEVFSKLRHLSLSFSHLSLKGLCPLPLESLYARKIGFQDRDITKTKPAHAITMLKDLSAQLLHKYDTRIIEDYIVPESWMSRITTVTLQQLDLSENGIKDEDLSFLGPLVRLKILALGRNPLTHKCLEPIGRLTNLTQLHLNHTMMSDQNNGEGHNLLFPKSLKRLCLDNTAYYGHHINDLLELPVLRELSLRDTKLTKEARQCVYKNTKIGFKCKLGKKMNNSRSTTLSTELSANDQTPQTSNAPPHKDEEEH
jgi:hypothetical protein